MVQHLSSKHENLNSNPSTEKKKESYGRLRVIQGQKYGIEPVKCL
jgi:hypothetical protein